MNNDEMKMMLEYFDSVNTHRRLVLQIGQVVGLPVSRLIQHDLSKYDPAEFIPYADMFATNDWDKESGKKAWLHHVNFNPHHWEHWCLCSAAEPMALNDIREMITDWQAAEIQYQKRQDMSKWLNKNVSKMLLHEDTRNDLDEVLYELGYYRDGEYKYRLNKNDLRACDVAVVTEDYLESLNVKEDK